MSRAPGRRAPAVLGWLLIVMGVGLALFGAQRWWASWERAEATPTLWPPSASPAPSPTATEPILPPPPTRGPGTAALQATRQEAASAAPWQGTPARQATPPAQPSPAAEQDPSTSRPGTPHPTSPPTTLPAATRTAGPTEPAGPPTAMPSAVSTAAAPRPTQQAALYAPRERIGVGGGGPAIQGAEAQRLGFGWYLDWQANPGAWSSAEVEYMPMVRLAGGEPSPKPEALRAMAMARPGALWLIGNEPDVKWQDNVTPAVYAEAYHELYALLKAADPSCRVAIGGVSQPTPLRLRYLDLVLQAYEARYGQAMPVDVWNVHNFVLREERGSWGVDIPPGMDDQAGVLREIADHDSLILFGQQIVEFRRWMKARGQQEKELLLTEYGILMPADYGFPPERVDRFMLGTFEYLRTAADPELGPAADGYRLVQRWCWFSLADERYPTGNLLSSGGDRLSPLGEAFRRYSQALPPAAQP